MKNNLTHFTQPLNKLINWIMPASDCLLCQLEVKRSQCLAPIICDHCHARLPLLNNTCPICALPLTQANEFACGECLKLTPPFKKSVAAFHYEPPMSDFITQLKFNHQRHLVPLMTEYLSARIQVAYAGSELPREIIAVPLHPKKLRQRGFNQAQLIATRLAKQLAIPYQATAVKRVRNTVSQVNLDAAERQRNLKGAFSVALPLQSHVVIVDDVMTTGTTVSELARTLLAQGVKRVDVWCVARAFTL